MRATWDELASAPELYVGDSGRGEQELDGLFGRLGADPRGGICLEVGCGSGRMTAHLAGRFDRVVALDVSPAMLEHARAATAAAVNVEFRLVSGRQLDGVEDGLANTLICYLVLQHLPRRALILGYLAEFARVLAPGGEAFVQLPVLRPGLRPRLRRFVAARATGVLSRLSRDPASRPAFRGVRLREAELRSGLDAAGLEVLCQAEGPDAPYRHATDFFMRLRAAPR